MTLEDGLTTLGMALYLLAAAAAAGMEATGRRRYGLPMAILAAALIAHGAGIGLRWERLGHGPYVNQYEILTSNIHTLHSAVLLGVLVAPRLRPLLAALLPLLAVMVVWFLFIPPADTLLPVTYTTFWLPVHVWLGKLFMGIMTIAVGGSAVILLRWGLGDEAFPMLPAAEAIDDVDARLVMLAFTFECAMLVAGAAWAQDAWGRYWSWDPLETWSFATWLAVAAYIHLRLVVTIPPRLSAAAQIGLFILAYHTFFGIPFVSSTAHKGIF
jgi:ABC-type transport system involved in cytochrome c biogenesis permease subunit